MPISVQTPSVAYYRASFPVVDAVGYNVSGVKRPNNVIVRTSPVLDDRLELVVLNDVFVHVRDDATGAFFPVTMQANSTVRVSDGKACLHGQEHRSGRPHHVTFRIMDYGSLSFKGLWVCGEDQSWTHAKLDDLVMPRDGIADEWFSCDLIDPMSDASEPLKQIETDGVGKWHQTALVAGEDPGRQAVADDLLLHSGQFMSHYIFVFGCVLGCAWMCLYVLGCVPQLMHLPCLQVSCIVGWMAVCSLSV
jgi:hypothetical protein